MGGGGVKVGKASGFKLRTQNSEYKWNADYLIGRKTRQGPGLGLECCRIPGNNSKPSVSKPTAP